jgi:CheY-like chemotaxis protein/predicted DNA-binding transcriptional regulator AlpA
MPDKEFLNSWKEVAQFVGRSERTIQRWERDLGFPVHRPAGRSRGSVIALRTEIQEWIEKTPITHIVKEPRKPLTVLCIDDNLENLPTRKAFLEGNGYRVLVGTDCASAEEVFEQNGIDLVILSSPMEDLDGEVMARILTRRKPKVPIVIALSGQEYPPAAACQLVRRVVRASDGEAVLLAVLQDCVRGPRKIATFSSHGASSHEAGDSATELFATQRQRS